MQNRDFANFFCDFQVYRLRPGNILKLIRTSLDLTTREFAKKTKLSQTDVVLCETGQRPFPEKKLFMFLDELEKLYQYDFFSTLVINRKDNLSPVIKKKISLRESFTESMLRENFIKSIINICDQGFMFGFGRDLLRKLIFNLFIEKSYSYGYNNEIIFSPKVLSLITYFQGYVDIVKAINLDYIESNILNKDKDIIEAIILQSKHTFKEDCWLIDICMLLFKSLSINLEDRFIEAHLYQDITPPKKITVCLETGLLFTDKILNNIYHL
ncbi:hypothetical protein SAMN02745133_00754 [Desulforamulus putei DSM 12395]|uniref:Uncharacterized protein n=1 Tax=Desulforamulus putei DSM 12395 TaxID=1121429 RepID=A0A1M4UT14_9FIRM|nr:hypothetical protein [Desulforamulus putei]SHE59866.1 hypothetical protein SAMN02745133_00754 [Desulforamulus putei DSM 12395]